LSSVDASLNGRTDCAIISSNLVGDESGSLCHFLSYSSHEVFLYPSEINRGFWDGFGTRDLGTPGPAHLSPLTALHSLLSPAHFSDETALGEGDGHAVADHEVIEHAHIDQREGIDEPTGEAPIGIAGLGHARG